MSDATHRSSTLLVCDDERLVLFSITSALRQAGYNVIEADNGDDAILLAREHRPDLAILDIKIKGQRATTSYNNSNPSFRPHHNTPSSRR